ncbi:MAG: riboflavin synthase subunit alpha [Candidatus Aminicenantes bacterium RBG_19FT_COMBO_58_17]|jgi:riboflavin synthase|nr:MAG: riboflavin synthase subunit alpha [Candidatus Aminicenantes bacterium RBG_19FT_COMBO_58_17]
MFTGIIHHQGFFRGFRSAKKELAVEVPVSFPVLEIGESVAVEGVCLSLLRREANTLFFNLSQETLAKTNLGSIRGGGRLNLELPLTLQTPVGGHLVSGHVDGLGRVLRITEKPPGRRLTISFPRQLRPYFVPKGSVAVNGVSLTVADVRPTSFDVELIPLTVAKSSLRDLRPGLTVNLECDIIGKYVYNWVSRGKNRA